MGWDIRYLWTLVLKVWILNWFENAHADKTFHFFAVRVKKSFWNFDIHTVLKVNVRPWVVVPALVSRTRFLREGVIIIISELIH